MKGINKFFNIIFRNWLAKIVSVLLACALWIYVGIGQTKTANFPGGVPLQIRNVPQGMVAITDIERVTIKIVADADTWKKLSVDSFTAYLDLTNLTVGTHEIKIIVTTSVANVQIVEIDPSNVLVRLESREEKQIPVNVLIDGKAGGGLVPGQWQVEPAVVKVSGAKSIVENLLEATAKIHLAGETSDFKKVTKLVGLNAQGEDISNLSFSPSDVTVSVPIVKASNVKTVGIKVVTAGNPAEGYWVSKIETDPQTVTIATSESQIAQINYIETAEVNIANIAKNTTIETTLKPQSGVSILDNISKIKVDIFISKNQATKEVEAGFKWENLTSNFKVTSVDPTTVKVVVSGPQETLAGLSAEDIIVLVDLSKVTTAGTYSMDISRANISGPAGVSVSSIVPSAINVRVDTK